MHKRLAEGALTALLHVLHLGACPATAATWAPRNRFLSHELGDGLGHGTPEWARGERHPDDPHQHDGDTAIEEHRVQAVVSDLRVFMQRLGRQPPRPLIQRLVAA